MKNSAILLMESRIHGDMYIRFGGRYGETYHCKVARRSMPSLLTCIDKDTKEHICYDDYKNLTNEEKAQYNVYPKNQVFRVFNVEQTNLKEARPGLWAKFEEKNKRLEVNQGEQYSFEPMDVMIHDNRWICPIKLRMAITPISVSAKMRL